MLGSWINVSGINSVLDIGSGSGILMLMAAQRTDDNVRIEGVECDQNSAEQSKINIKNSKWSDRLNVYQNRVQDHLVERKYDLIMSNPPFFSKSHKPPGESRATSRHDVNLDFVSLIEACKRFSHSKTRLNFVLPYTEGVRFIGLMCNASWYLTRKCSVRGRDHKPLERLLLEFQTENLPTDQQELSIMGKGDEWSESYRELTSVFYLKG